MLPSVARWNVVARGFEILPHTVSWHDSDTFHDRFQITTTRFQTGSSRYRRNRSETISARLQATFNLFVVEPFNEEFPDTVSSPIAERLLKESRDVF